MPGPLGFLDTDIQIHRKSPDPKVSVHCEAFVGQLGFRTVSKYSRLEFKRALLQQLAYLQRKIHDCGSLEAAGMVVLELDPRQDRKLKMALKHLISLMSSLNRTPHGLTDSQLAQRACLVLENQVQSLWDWFEYSVDNIENRTGCVRADEAPQVKRGLLDVSVSRCKPSRVLCTIDQFFEREKASFERLKEFIDGLPDPSAELVRHSEIIGSAGTDSRHLCDDHVCARFGDALIAVECMCLQSQSVKLVTSNKKEHVATTAALDIELMLYEAPRGPGIAAE